MTSDARPPFSRRLRATAVIVAAVLVGVAGVVVLRFFGVELGESLVIVATVGTALGTLGLALYTYRLAKVTRQSVEGGEHMAKIAADQLAEIQGQRALLAKQSNAAIEQAAESHRLSDATIQAVLAADKARIDAVSPLVDLQVELAKATVVESGQERELSALDQWPESALEHVVFNVTLKFVFTNVSKVPARLTFGDTSTRLEKVARERIHTYNLYRYDSFVDHYKLRFVGTDALAGELLRVPVTYDGLLHGEMFDHIQWNGWVTPLLVNDGVAKRHELLLNASSAQVLRSYPNLDRPDEMAVVRRRLLGLEE